MTTCTCDTFTSSTTSPALNANNTATGGSSGHAIYATSGGNTPTLQASNSGSTSNAMAIYATATSVPFCIFGEGGSVGVFGKSYATGGIGVRGEGAGGSGSYGGYFTSDDTTGGIGAYFGAPTAVQAVGTNYGGTFRASGTGTPSTNAGVWTMGNTGVYGTTNASSGGYGGYFMGGTYGLYSYGTSYGGYFLANNSAGACGVTASGYTGVLGSAGAAGGMYGIFGDGGSNGNWAGYFNNKVYVAGLLTKAGGGYQIDHPTDPENKYLTHCFVESPEMMNVYRGRAVFDDKGEAVVTLPSYFSAAAEAPEYQLTAVGARMPELYVAEEVKNGSFKIGGGLAGLSVSWQVTAARADKWAKANHPGVEVDKLPEHKGKFLHPELFGADSNKNIHPNPPKVEAQK